MTLEDWVAAQSLELHRFKEWCQTRGIADMGEQGAQALLDYYQFYLSPQADPKGEQLSLFPEER